MSPKLKKKKTVIPSTSDEETGYTSEDLVEEESEDRNSDSDQDEEEEEDDDSASKNDSKPRKKISDMLENKKGKMVSVNSCKNHLYQGHLENIKDVLNGSTKNEIDIKEGTSDKNQPTFKNVPTKWGWKQELMLLEGIEAKGLFNWELIAQQLSEQSGKIFKAEEVKNHYFQYYYNGTLGQVWNYQLEGKSLEHFDHTDPIVSTNKYLPRVEGPNLREIKFMPHRGDFEEYPPNEIEMMLTRLDFSSFYMDKLKALKIDEEVRDLQLIVVEAYREVVADRMKMYKLMKDFNLIEQFIQNFQKKTNKKWEIDRYFAVMQKFIGFFNSPKEFIKFYFDCAKEKALKLEIARLNQILATKKSKERDPGVETLLKKRAPSFLDVGLLLDTDKDLILYKSKKRKKKFKFTRRKRSR